ncbi:unnamed protein product [Trifolium pratense]|uniref:Uncharacterized protein n=1 Tax=Trifolium pratense TaxID=57577 RepID=A0ACB0IS54_TRIPR|nr:unnamed protein product [Trifolium pratense]
MSSSSSSSFPNHQWLYDVFLNFRGEDTRSKFVSHLHASLSNAGINTFVDYQLDKGTELESELLQAIEDSHISIVVFSKTYTESSWCLNELEKIMKCRRNYGQIVVPIFYDVDPSVVRHQKGAYGNALRSTAEKRYSAGEAFEYVLSRWRIALTEASNLSGWDLTNCRNENELMQQIVEDVLTKIQNTFLSITEYPVGLESRVEQVIQFIEKQSSKVSMIGIWGMGGSGKTTTAKAIYNRIHRKFVDRSFIENVREVSEKDNRGIIHLQEQLLSDVLKTKERIHNIAFGPNLIENRLKGKRALVVLDDVTTSEQLKALCGNPKLFGSGSVLIVTTRDVRLLNLLSADYVCTMTEMDKKESLELFSWHAFRRPIPSADFDKLSKNVVAYSGGLPLALEVLGSYLYERTEQEWKGVLSKLGRIPNDQVQEKLRISYDGLEDDTEKDIFLDICCFFIGKDISYVTEILNGCGLYANIGIPVLIERSLVKVGKNNKLGMHDLLRDMGREIVRESSARVPGKRSRLWFRGDVLDVLTTNTGTKTVEGLVLKSQSTGEVCFSADSFKEMKKLRLLQLDHVDLTGDFGYLSKEVRWLHWQGYTGDYMPGEFYQGNLVVVDLRYSYIKRVWKETMLMDKLKILNLSHSKYLEITPDFSKLPNLEKLIMKDCPSLSKIHHSIGDLKNVLLINLKDCTGLRNLPRKIYQLKSLKTFILSGCSKIDKLEEDIVQMESLTTLVATNTGVKQVPFSIVRSKSIVYISLCGFEGSSRNVFPSLIRSWMAPTMNSLLYISPFGSVSLSLASLVFESDNSGYLSPNPSSLSKLGRFWVHYRLYFQVTQELRTFLDDLYNVNFTVLEDTSHESQSSSYSLRSLLMKMSSCHGKINNTLGESISQRIRVDSDEDYESLPPFKRSRKYSNEKEWEDLGDILTPTFKKLKIKHSKERRSKAPEGRSRKSQMKRVGEDSVNSYEEAKSSFKNPMKKIENPQQVLPPVKNKEPDTIKVPSGFINTLPQENILEKDASTPIISLSSQTVKQEKVNESITSKSSTSKGPSATENVEKVSSKQASVSEYSPVDYSKYKELIEEDPLAMMEKLLSGELSFSSKTSQSTKQAEATQVERERINTLLDDLRHLVFSSNLLKYLPNDMNRREKVKGLLFELDDRVDELSEKQVLGLVELTKIFNEAEIIIDGSRDNADSLQELEVNHKNTMSKLQASKDKMKRFAESIAAGQNKIQDIDHEIEDIQTQIQLLKQQVNKLRQEKSLLKDTCSKCHEKRVYIMKEVKSISSEAVEILEKTSQLEKKEQEFNLNYKRLQEHYTKMKLAPPF